MKDPEKKQFYDKYGSEEEFREKYQQQHHHEYYEEEIDPYDLFEMFFSGQHNFYQRGGRVFRRTREERAEHQPRQRQPPPRHIVLIQLLPIIVLFLFSVVPYLFQSVNIKFTQKPYFQFHPDEEYFKKMTTYNKIDYYVGDKFLNNFKDPETIRNVNNF